MRFVDGPTKGEAGGPRDSVSAAAAPAASAAGTRTAGLDFSAMAAFSTMAVFSATYCPAWRWWLTAFAGSSGTGFTFFWK